MKPKIPASTASGPSADLLGAEHAGDADHAAVEDRIDEERARGRRAAAADVGLLMAMRNGFPAAQKGLSVAALSRPSEPRVTDDPRLDVLAIGDAVVDVIATADDDFLAEEGLVKGSMQVLDAAGATRLYARMSQARETSGGSAANTMAGIAALGGRAGFVGQVARRPARRDFQPRHPRARRRVPHAAEIAAASRPAAA